MSNKGSQAGHDVSMLGVLVTALGLDVIICSAGMEVIEGMHEGRRSLCQPGVSSQWYSCP